MSTDQRRILTVTLNPALDVTTTTEKLLPQQKLRCDAPRLDPGGGGVNVSRVIKELGGESTAFVTLGGSTGTQLEVMLAAAGLDCEIWRDGGETRSSLTVMEAATGLHYRFVMPGPTHEASDGPRLLERLRQVLARGYDYVVASGSLPPGLPEDFYGRIAEAGRAFGARLILDTHGAALSSALSHRPYLIRLNHLEAQELLGGLGERAARDLARDLVSARSAEIAIVTFGDKGAIVATAAETYQIAPPKVSVRSMVGAGDSFVGALTLGLSRDWSVEKAARYGVAAAAAAVTSEGTELCKADMVEALFGQIPAAAPMAHQSRSASGTSR